MSAGYAPHFELLAAGGELVTATRRQAEAIARAWNERQRAAGRTVWPTPRIRHWNAWLEHRWHGFARESLPERRLLDGWSAVRAFERVVAASDAGRGLLDGRAAARGAWRSWQRVHDWALDVDALEPGTPEQAAFVEWARRHRATCAARGWLDPAALPAALATAAHDPDPAAGRPLGFHGFLQLVPARARLVRALESAGRPVRELRVGAAAGRTYVHAAATPEAELEAIAAWLVARLRADPAARLAVVLPDLGTRWRTVRRALDDLLQPGLLATGAPDERPYALVAGPRLRDYAVVDAALQALALGRERLELLAVGRLLRSPYLRGAESEAGPRARLDAWLRRAGDLQPRSDWLRQVAGGERGACPAFAASVAAAQGELARGGRRRPAAWAQAFERALRAAGWPEGRPLASTEFQAARKLQELLPALAALEGVLPPLDLDAALAELGALAAETLFQPDTGDAPVLVLDAHEDPGLALDGLWVAGLGAERFPGAAAPDPFLPLALQRRLGLPHASAELELARARRTLAAWSAGADELVLSYSRRDADGERVPSPLLPAAAPPSLPAPLPRRAAVLQAAARRVAWQDTRLPPLPAGARLPGGVAVLELQSACPFRAGAERRLGVRALERPRAGLDPRERGELAHAALAALWRELRTQAALASLAPGARVAHVRAAIDRACADLGAERRTSRLLALEREWLERAMLALLEVELGRAPFEVIAQEQDDELQLGAARLAVRVDRIDRLEDGATVVIDYKTGRSLPRRWTGPRPDRPQLPAYAAHRDPPPVAVAFGRLALVANGYAGLAARRGLLPGVRAPDQFRHPALRGRSWESLVEEWRRVTTALAGDFAAGIAGVDPADGACEHCALGGLCRIETRRGAAEEDDATPAEDAAGDDAGAASGSGATAAEPRHG